MVYMEVNGKHQWVPATEANAVPAKEHYRRASTDLYGEARYRALQLRLISLHDGFDTQELQEVQQRILQRAISTWEQMVEIASHMRQYSGYVSGFMREDSPEWMTNATQQLGIPYAAPEHNIERDDD